MPPIETVTCNARLSKARRVVEGGVSYLVTPLTSLVPGVLNGSRGPLFYPPEEVGAVVKDWDGIPLTVYHPFDAQGRPASASDPGIYDRQGVGHLRRSTFNGKLRHEAWFNEDEVKRVDPRVHSALLSGSPMEVSTGLFTRNDPTPGEWKGRSYEAVARNHRPDHMAILPDQRGACSMNDGCGLNVNASNIFPPAMTQAAEVFATLLHAATGAHQLHLAATSYAKHKALEKLYEALPDLADQLIEAWQGVNGTIAQWPDGYKAPVGDPLAWVTAVRGFVEANRMSVGSQTELQNMVDEILGAFDSAIYKLRFLS